MQNISFFIFFEIFIIDIYITKFEGEINMLFNNRIYKHLESKYADEMRE